MARGGFRVGAGRKKGLASVEAEMARASIAKKINDNLDSIIGPQIKKAQEGDTQAFKELLNRAFGMPRQNLGLDGGEEGEPIEVIDVSTMTPEQINEYLKLKIAGGSA